MRVLLVSVFSMFSLLLFSQERPFITTWKTDEQGPSCSTCVLIPIKSYDGGQYKVDWDNDGIYDVEGLDDLAYHDFGIPGTYSIAIYGTELAIDFFVYNQLHDSEKLLSIDQWGDVEWSSFGNGFATCKNLELKAMDTPDLSKVDNMDRMFSGAEKMNADLSEWDVSNVRSFNGLFQGASSFNSDLSSWDLGNAETTSRMFMGAVRFNSDVSKWDVSNVQLMRNMFEDATSFNSNLMDWDVSLVREMDSMFEGASSFNQDLKHWNVENVFGMESMFEDATAFNGEIKKWNVSKVVRMGNMFKNAVNFNHDLSEWSTPRVRELDSMFFEAIKFNHHLGTWDLSSTDYNSEALLGMLDNCGLDPNNYQATLEGWAANASTPDNHNLGSLHLEYCDNTPREELFSKGWTITGDSEANEDDCITAVKNHSSELRPVLFPTPTNTDIRVAKLNGPGHYSIFDKEGNRHGNGAYHENSGIIVEQLSPGLYFLLVETVNKTYSLSFIKS